jgi:hypothetical protein
VPIETELRRVACGDLHAETCLHKSPRGSRGCVQDAEAYLGSEVLVVCSTESFVDAVVVVQH